MELAAQELYAFRHDELDISDRAAVEAMVVAFRPEWIVNAAAFNDVDAAETQPERAFAVNADGPAYLAEAGARVGARLLHISTDYVFNGRKGSAYSEPDPPDPLSVYGRSKLAGERRVLESGAGACVLRTAWLYGRGGKNFVKAILAAVKRGEVLKVVADQVGSPTSTRDLAGAIGELLETDLDGLFHVANAGACSRYDFARAIVRERVEVMPMSSSEAARPAPRPVNSSLKSVRWGEAGMRPLRAWEAALNDFLAGALPG